MSRFLIAAFALLAAFGSAEASCPSQSPSVTIPMSGDALVTVYDSATCNPLAGPFAVGIPGSALGAATRPAFTVDAAGVLHFIANGAPFGSKLSGTITFSPDPSKSMPLAIVVGGTVSGLVAGTTSP